MAGISTKHPDFEEAEETWDFCEAFYEGSATVKREGKKYLPALSGQSTQKYNDYKARALIPGFVPRTVAALVGAIFRREPHFAVPERIKYILENADNEGSSLTQLAIKVVTELMVTGRAILVIDRPTDGGNPYICFYDADDLTNWSTSAQFFVLENNELVPSSQDKYTLEEVEGYRELFIDPVDGTYIVNTWRPQGENGDFVIVDTQQPLNNGRPINYVPIVCVTPTDLGFDVAKPPIQELCEVAQTSYRVSADWLNALHVAACPTPVVSADIEDKDNFVLNLGPDTVLLLPMGGKAEYLESKTELGALEKAMTKLENLAAILGARLLDTGAGGVMETATSAMIKESASTAILSSIISSTEAAIYKCLVMIAEAEAVDSSSIEVALNKELVQARVDANMLNALVAALQSGSISLDTFYHNIQEGGLTEPGISVADESKRILEGVGLMNAINPPKTVQPQVVEPKNDVTP